MAAVPPGQLAGKWLLLLVCKVRAVQKFPCVSAQMNSGSSSIWFSTGCIGLLTCIHGFLSPHCFDYFYCWGGSLSQDYLFGPKRSRRHLTIGR